MEPDQQDRDREVVEAQEAVAVVAVVDAAGWGALKPVQALEKNVSVRAAEQLFRSNAEFRAATRLARIAGPG